VNIGHHLARHGLKPEVRRVVAREVDVASTILSYTAETSTSLIVMGGYGHSPVRVDTWRSYAWYLNLNDSTGVDVPLNVRGDCRQRSG
jgi:hypothetical protein